jgi:hypothetical protein
VAVLRVVRAVATTIADAGGVARDLPSTNVVVDEAPWSNHRDMRCLAGERLIRVTDDRETTEVFVPEATRSHQSAML